MLAAGCGGGGGGESKPSASTTPAPSGAPEETADPAAAARAAVADRRDAIKAEVRALRALKSRQVSNLYYKLDGLALELGSKHFQADSGMLERMTARITGSGLGSGYAAFQQRNQRREWATLVPTWKRYAAKLARVRARGAVARSVRDFQLAEWRRSIAVMREFLGYLRRESPESTHDSYYQARAFGQSSRWSVVIAEPYNARKRLVRGLRRDLRRLRGTEELGPRSPSVGDVYRRAIVQSFLSPLREVKRREPIVARQQWMLYRLSQLEGTPRDAYEDARSTIALQGLVDARNPYAGLRDIGLAQMDHYIVDERDLRRARRLRTWALKLLARPVPPMLERTRTRMVNHFKSLHLTSPPSYDRFEIFDISKQVERSDKRMERILRQGAKLVDSPRKLRKATIDALRATRPSP